VRTVRTIRQLLLVTIFILTAALQINAQDILVTSFETNSPGSINNQGHWEVESGTAVVTAETSLYILGLKV